MDTETNSLLRDDGTCLPLALRMPPEVGLLKPGQ